MPPNRAHFDQPGTVGGGIRWTIRVGAMLALLISGYLSYVALFDPTAKLAGCGGALGDCANVLATRWSQWLYVPVTLFAAVIYVVLLIASFYIAPFGLPRHRRRAWMALIGAASLVLLAALWFVVVQAVIKQLCVYCMAAHLCGSIAAVAVLVSRPVARSGGEQIQPVLPTPGQAGALAAAAVALMVVLGVGQWLGPAPDTHIVQNIDVSPPEANGGAANLIDPSDPPDKSPPVAVVEPPTTRTVEYLEGRLVVDVGRHILIGSPDAPVVIVELADYTCQFCRQVSPLLEEAVERYDGQLAVVVLLTPLNRRCNHRLPVGIEDHANACEYARLSLAMRVVDREASTKFHKWLINGPKPPGVAEARRYAETLVATDALTAASQDPWIDQTLNQAETVFDQLIRSTRNPLMPKFFLGGNSVASGLPQSKAALFSIFEKQLGLKPVPGS